MIIPILYTIQAMQFSPWISRLYIHSWDRACSARSDGHPNTLPLRCTWRVHRLCITSAGFLVSPLVGLWLRFDTLDASDTQKTRLLLEANYGLLSSSGTSWYIHDMYIGHTLFIRPPGNCYKLYVALRYRRKWSSWTRSLLPSRWTHREMRVICHWRPGGVSEDTGRGVGEGWIENCTKLS